MPSLILSFLRSHWAGVSALVMLAVLSVMSVLHQSEVLKLKLALQECHSASQGLTLSNASLLAAVKEQNAAIEHVRTETDRKRAAAKRAAAETTHRKETAGINSAALMGMPLSGDECAQMKQVLHEYLRVSDAVRQSAK